MTTGLLGLRSVQTGQPRLLMGYGEWINHPWGCLTLIRVALLINKIDSL